MISFVVFYKKPTLKVRQHCYKIYNKFQFGIWKLPKHLAQRGRGEPKCLGTHPLTGKAMCPDTKSSRNGKQNGVTSEMTSSGILIYAEFYFKTSHSVSHSLTFTISWATSNCVTRDWNHALCSLQASIPSTGPRTQGAMTLCWLNLIKLSTAAFRLSLPALGLLTILSPLWAWIPHMHSCLWHHIPDSLYFQTSYFLDRNI